MCVMNLLTVDLEDWFHICEVEHLLPREKWDRLPSTVVADTEKLPDLIRRIHDMGHEIGYHGWEHELVYELSPQEFRQILRRGIECIERLIDKRPIGFRAPQWSIKDRSGWALEILSEEGFVYDSSMAPLKIIGNESYPRTPWKINTSTGDLWEFPPMTLKTPFGHYPAGGSWGLRLLPYPILRQRVREFNKRQLPALFYFHPREFGRKRTVTGLPFGKKFALHTRIWASESQLRRLLADFRFASVVRYLDSR